MTTNTPTTDLDNSSIKTGTHGTAHSGAHGAAPGAPGHGGQLHSEPPKSKKKGLIWAVLMLAVIAVAGYAVWQAGQPAPVNPNAQGGQGKGRRGGGGGGGNLGPVPVVLAKAVHKSVPVYQVGLGNVSAFYTVTVKSRVDGQLMSVKFQEGDYVKEGQLLAEIDPRPYQVQLEQAQGSLARDQAILADAKLDLDRYKTLLSQDAIPKQQLDTQTATVGQTEGNLKTDQANIDNAKLQIVYSKITAPITGRIGLRLTDPGNIVHASDAAGLFVITQLQPISVLFTIPEDAVGQIMTKLRAGVHMPVDAWNRDNSKKIAQGTLLTVDNQIDPSTGTSKLKAVFANEDNALFPNQFVNMRLLVDTLPNALVVPSVAVQHGQQGNYVYLVDPQTQKVKLQTVQAGISDGDIIVVTGGLSEGEQVVVDGTDRLQNGTTVRVRQPGAPDAPGGGPAGGGGGGNRKGKGKKQ